MHVLVLNCGSSSVKYQLIDCASFRVVASGRKERIAHGGHVEAIRTVIAELDGNTIEAVGHRVVHGGRAFSDAVLIDEKVLSAIAACVPLAPLHNPANLDGIRAAMKALPGVPQVAVFDTAFHSTLPRRARTYAIDPAFAHEHGIERYGFHGTSHAFVSREAARFLGRPIEKLRLVSCHLGNGASATAIECGHSVETSMGMTPLEGLVMGTRSGDIDPGALLQLIERGAVTAHELDEKLQKHSGLLGLSGVSNDLRDIENRAAAGDERSRLAIGVFAHRVRKYIGAYAATMGGLDAVLLTGGIGENSAAMRRRILQRFEFLGLVVDDDLNVAARVSSESRVVDIAASHSPVRALVIATDEERMIAEDTERIARGQADVGMKTGLAIAVSARHVHLDKAKFAKLFGGGQELTKHKELSQPGQFACNEKVNLVGPRGRIDGVRILGPLRPDNQVEISRTDEFTLGVDAPVRLSGDVKGTAGITLEGPAGKVHLDEGLICAWRHIHMTPEDAERFGVEDHDEVQVAITGGVRDLVFGDVVVRVSSKFSTEMHIDTDEANAAELPARSEGALVAVPGAEAVLQRRRTQLR